VSGAPTAIAVADFNGDRRPDFAVTDASENSVKVISRRTIALLVSAAQPKSARVRSMLSPEILTARAALIWQSSTRIPIRSRF
jgi:hypothetical protein